MKELKLLSEGNGYIFTTRQILPASRPTSLKFMSNFCLKALTILLFVTTHVHGQYKTYFGLEGAITNDVSEIADYGNNFKNAIQIQSFWGFNVRQDLPGKIFLETSLIRKNHNTGYGVDGFPGSFGAGSIRSFIASLRLGTKINIHREKIYLVPVIGYSFGFNRDYSSFGYSSSGYGSGGVNIGNDSFSYTISERYNLAKNFSLLQTGLGFEFGIFKKAILSVSANYFTGFQKISESDITYKINNSSPTTAKVYSKGEFWSLGIGFRYPIGDFWKKE